MSTAKEIAAGRLKFTAMLRAVQTYPTLRFSADVLPLF
jgi:hypothetical protein